MKNRLIPHPLTQRGQTLIIVMMAIVLLSALVVGILVSALYNRKIAANSASQNKADLAAQGAISQIIADLRQEIVDGSSTTTAPYIPNNAACMVPFINAYAAQSPQPPAGTGLENLIKASIAGTASYQNGGYNGAVYNNPGVARASTAQTTVNSLNGHNVSLARWQQPKLTASAPTVAFPTPNWILVAADGTNPTGAFASAIYGINGTNPVTQRYAYTVYDEGGTLDLNVAGYPLGGKGASTLYPYKNALAYADLTQISDGNGNYITPAQVNKIVGWRNNATLQAAGNLTSGYTFASSAPLSYFDSFVLSNSSGYLQVGNGLTSYNSTNNPAQSDSAFTSRQQMLQFLNNIGIPADSQRYFGTFTRDINQPSIISPALHGGPTIQAYDATKPANPGAGNNAYGLDNNSNPLAQINPDFLSVTITQAMISAGFTRNDGTLPVAGEPLVKKRFDLNRLAWLTYQGPIADANGNLNPSGDPGVNNIINSLETQYGFSPAFLKQGTPQNVYNYFGLSWVQDKRTTSNGKGTLGDSAFKWYYNHKGTTPYTNALTSFAGAPNPAWSLLNLAQAGISSTYGTTLPREPDFFELLKGSVMAGSKAKLGTTGSNVDTLSDQYQTTQVDPIVQYAIVQLGANIIDQFDLDGYPTDIIYQDGTTYTKEIFGVENLPYIYRVRPSFVQGKAPIVNIPTTDSTNFPDGFIVNPGWLVCFITPEIWNPHDQNSPRCAVDSSGNFLQGAGGALMPTNFRATMDSIDPDNVINDPNQLTISTNGYKTGDTTSNFFFSNNVGYHGVEPQSTGGPDNTTPVDPAGPWAAWAGTETKPTPLAPVTSYIKSKAYYYTSLFPITSASTALYFQDPPGLIGLFRESTFLNQPLLPKGSNLTAVPSNLHGLASGTISKNMLDPSIPLSSKIPTNNGSTAVAPDLSGFTDANGAITTPYNNTKVFGFYMGVYPNNFNWYGTRSYGPPNPKTVTKEWLMQPNLMDYGQNDTYRLQYQDASGLWRTYDQKYAYLYAHDVVAIANSNSQNPANLLDPNTFLGLVGSAACDPRTSRFGLPSGSMMNPFSSGGNSGRYGVGKTWLDTNGGATDPVTYATKILAPFAQGASVSNAYFSGRPDFNGGFGIANSNGTLTSMGWSINTFTAYYQGAGFSPGLLSQNSPVQQFSNSWCNNNSGGPAPVSSQGTYYKDADGVVRRSMGAWCNPTITGSGGTVGLPMATGYADGNSLVNGVANQQIQSRPIVLNRPFATVGELGHTFSGTPWKNLDFFTPESGDSPLLDVFCVGETSDPNGLVAGKINLNTRQVPVLTAILSGAYQDEQNNYATKPGWSQPNLTAAQAKLIAQTLVNRTSNKITNGSGPLQNMTELVGKYLPNPNVSSIIQAYDNQTYDGFSNDLTNLFASYPGIFPSTINNIQRMREAAVRALNGTGTTRVWNLMIDVIAQSGRYPKSATSSDNFVVEGEQHYWVHIAIDRLTGNILDKKVELIKQ